MRPLTRRYLPIIVGIAAASGLLGFVVLRGAPAEVLKIVCACAIFSALLLFGARLFRALRDR